MKLFIVDAFTETKFGGNQAGVVILPEGQDYPDDNICIKVAAELRYSETAFIKVMGPTEFQIRYFTPAAEVDLCGHATIASFKTLLEKGYIKSGDKCINHTLAGDLEIEVKDDFVLMEMGTPEKLNEIEEHDKLTELYSIMGLDYDAQDLSLNPQMISTGLPDIMMPVKSLEELENIAPDFPALAKLSEHYNVVGVHAFTTNCEDATCHVRNFAPLYDIDEEAATGTSNGALTYYGYLNGFIKSGDDCKFVQGEKMDRPSVILSHIEEKDGNVKIQVGGSAVLLVEGEIEL